MINSRTKGHKFEQGIASELRELFPDCITSRQGNRALDAQGIDLCNTGKYAIQCKRYKNYVSVNTIEEVCGVFGKECGLDRPTKIPLIFTKSDQVPIVITKGDYEEVMAIIPWKDLKDLIKVSNSHT